MLMLKQTSTAGKPKTTSSGCELGVTVLHNIQMSSPSVKKASKSTIIWEVQVAHLTTVRMGTSN